jgi:hypothetical protein
MKLFDPTIARPSKKIKFNAKAIARVFFFFLQPLCPFDRFGQLRPFLTNKCHYGRVDVSYYNPTIGSSQNIYLKIIYIFSPEIFTNLLAEDTWRK